MCPRAQGTKNFCPFLRPFPHVSYEQILFDRKFSVFVFEFCYSTVQYGTLLVSSSHGLQRCCKGQSTEENHYFCTLMHSTLLMAGPLPVQVLSSFCPDLVLYCTLLYCIVLNCTLGRWLCRF